MDHMPDMPMEPMHGSYRLPLPVAPGQGFSEFNHHLAGVVVLLIGVSAILMYTSPRKFDFLRYVWPVSLLALGIYLILYSDPEAWPSGYLGLSESLHNPETRQHKVYALLLLAMGSVELARATRVARGSGWKYVFPMLALAGAIYLIFHHHGETAGHAMRDMHGMDEHSMTLILYQHISYVVLGIGIAVTKVLHDMRRLPGKWGPYTWPTLTILLGIGLILYRE